MKTLEVDKYLKAVEGGYQELLAKYKAPSKKTSGIDQCVIRMARENMKSGKIWWNAWEFVGAYGELFGSHKAPARISDLSVYYPFYCESRPQGAYTVYRLRFENISLEEFQRMCLLDYKIDKSKRVSETQSKHD
jgi:hypothetical protein